VASVPIHALALQVWRATWEYTHKTNPFHASIVSTHAGSRV